MAQKGDKDSRNVLLEAIRNGKVLRSVTDRKLPNEQKSAGSGTRTFTFEDILRKALENRRPVLQSSDEENGNSENDGEFDD